MTEIMAISEHRNNAGIIADCARLGYIEGRVIDLTYGEGKFWTQYRPDDFVTNDLLKPADFHEDASETMFEDRTFDTVVFDPPYKLAGTPFNAGASDGGLTMDQRFGTEKYTSQRDIHALLLDGVAEAGRITRRWVLVKCMNQVNAGKIRWQTDDVTVTAAVMGLEKVDEFMLKRWRPQPEGRRQLHARRNYSTLLVFRKL